MFENKNNPSKGQGPVIITDHNFNDIINTDKGIVIDFYADWCGPCKILSPIMAELANEYGDKVVIGKVDTESNPQLSEYFKIRSIPTLMFIKNKQVIEVINGLVPKPNLEEMINDLIAFEFPVEEGNSEEE